MRNTISNILWKFPLLLLIVSLAACQTAPKRDPEFAAVRPPLPPVEPEPNGAIYQVGYETRFFEDVKARRVGDTLRVTLTETTSASKDASTSISKENTTDIDDPTILGTNADFDVPGFFPLANTSNLSLENNLSSSSEFDGSGSSSQNNNLTGNIAVSVVEVFPNGNLYIRGEKRVTLNQGNEYIRISGIVRPMDIQADNSILSTQIADATIMYTGDGPSASANVMGWLARFFIGAVMPF